MTRYDRRIQALAVSLSAIAGYVDAMAFRQFGGLFVSFMSGNTTRMGVSLWESGRSAMLAGGLILAFVLGALLGSVVGHRAKTQQRRAAVLLLVAITLGLAAIIGGGVFSALAMALAMGAENAVFEEDGDVRLGVTYMSGALAKVGQRLARAFAGGPRWAWASYALLWAGLLLGATIGAATHSILGLPGLWLAVGAVLLVGSIFALLDGRQGRVTA